MESILDPVRNGSSSQVCESVLNNWNLDITIEVEVLSIPVF